MAERSSRTAALTGKASPAAWRPQVLRTDHIRPSNAPRRHSSARQWPGILAVGAAAREDDVGGVAIGLQRLVHQNFVVARSPYPGREARRAVACGNSVSTVLNSVCSRTSSGDTFRPASRDVGEYEGLDEAAASRRAAMGHEVRLNEASRWIASIRRRSNGNAPSQGMRLAAASSSSSAGIAAILQ